MVVQCKVCTGDFDSSPDSIVLCRHKEGAVHFGCCVHDCSNDNRPCEHCAGTYDKCQ